MKRAESSLALVLVLTGFAAARQDLSDVFYKAVHLQDVKGDLEAAIPLFERVVTESKDPSLAAKAQLRIGMCYEKLGADTGTAGLSERHRPLSPPDPGSCRGTGRALPL